MQTPVYDVIVVGLGAMGSAALYQLAGRGVSVLGLDQFAPPHALGSSHGDTRITRLAVAEGEPYMPLVRRSHELWREIEQATGEELLTITGGLVISVPDRTGFWHGVDGFLDHTIALAQKHQVPHEILSADDIRRRFEPFVLRGDEKGYFEPGAGFVRPERCIAAQLRLAQQHGATIRVNERVTAIMARASAGVVVQTQSGSYVAEQLILSAGAWLPQLIEPQYAHHFQIFRQVVAWFDVEEPIAPYLPDRFPIYISIFGDGPDDLIYGFPALDGQAGGIKVGTERYLAPTTADASDRTVGADELDHIYRRSVAPHLRGVGARSVKAVSCLYTVTADHGFVIDRLPTAPNIILASPCSGHGFKHSAAIGELLAELVTTGSTTIDRSAFRLDRFGST